MGITRRSFMRRAAEGVSCAVVAGCGSGGLDMLDGGPPGSDAAARPDGGPRPDGGGASGARWRSIPMGETNNPFQSPYIELGRNVGKHVSWTWHAGLRRVFTWGGDYGASGPSDFGQPNGGQRFTTNDPVAPREYDEAGTGYRNDQYSLDPHAPGDATWRLEHPYVPRNMGGAPEQRPPNNCQQAIVYDPVRDRLWGIATIIRPVGLYGGDPWAHGTTYAPSPAEPPGTWSFTPDPAGGGAGTWRLETPNACVCRYGEIAYEGGRMYTGRFDERLAMWEHHAAGDVIVSAAYGPTVHIFRPETMTYEYRRFDAAGIELNGSSSQVACVGDFMYYVAVSYASGEMSSHLFRVNVSRALELPNGGTLPNDPALVGRWDLPWSLAPRVSEVPTSWQEQCGVVAIDGKVVLVKSYGGLVQDDIAKISVFDPETEEFEPGEAPPQNFGASSWVGLPETGEVLMGITTTENLEGNDSLWAYRVR